MTHKHEVRDSNEALVVDVLSRTIINPANKNITIVQYDHNSERITFKVPRYIDEHDMLQCDKVEIHYDNISNGTSISDRHINSDFYTVDDLILNPDDEDTVLFTWLISENATQLDGTVTFKLKFICYGDDNIADYVWNTKGCEDVIEVSTGFDNAKAIIERYPDALEQMKQEIIKQCGSGTVFDGKLVDQETEKVYKLYIENGKLMLEESEG